MFQYRLGKESQTNDKEQWCDTNKELNKDETTQSTASPQACGLRTRVLVFRITTQEGMRENNNWVHCKLGPKL